jgi:RHS repeat-associated protein
VDEPLVWYEGSGTSDRRWLIADHQGSIIAEHNGSGGIARYPYGPYGEPETWTGSRFRYTGQIALPEIGLYHYKARVYDPALGRFLQTDSIGYEDDINFYAYVRNDPLNFFDSNGWRAYMVSRRIFSEEQARNAASLAAAAAGGSAVNQYGVFMSTYNEVINTKHAFLVTTVGDTSLEQGQIDNTYSYGLGSDGTTSRMGPQTDTGRDDLLALDSIANGDPGPGVSYSEIEGLDNADANEIFGAPSETRIYAPVPSKLPGSTNSKAEAFARARAGAARARTTFTPPAGGHPGAGQTDRVRLRLDGDSDTNHARGQSCSTITGNCVGR